MLSSCIGISPVMKQPDCPKPEQNCSPALWQGMAIDTSRASAREQGWHYVVKAVDRINSYEDEYQLLMIDHKQAAVTFTDAGRQSVMLARAVNPYRFTILSGLTFPGAGHNGSLSLIDNTIAYASAEIPSESDVIKVGIDGAEYVWADKVIGQTRLMTGVMDKNHVKTQRSINLDLPTRTDEWYAQPAYYPTTRELIFFASDREGGFGGTDIWFTYISNGKWQGPFNCGNVINTKCDELSPYFSPRGDEFYFASAGHETVGGYDIFKAQLSDIFMASVGTSRYESLPEADIFTDIENLRPPINTEYDEIFPTCSVDCDSVMYFSSNRLKVGKTGSDFDIHVIYKEYVDDYTIPKFSQQEGTTDLVVEVEVEIKDEKLDIDPDFTLKGTVYAKSSGSPIADATVTAHDLNDSTYSQETTTDISGHYEIELFRDTDLQITAHKEELFYDTRKISVSLSDVNDIFVEDFFIPEQFTLRINFPTDMYDSPYRFTLDSNGQQTNETWVESIETLTDNIKISLNQIQKIILSGHTDDVGSDAYNEQLSKRRVDFVVAQLVARGVPASILEARYHGESKPLPRRKDEDLNQYRKRLRRVNLEKVLK